MAQEATLFFNNLVTPIPQSMNQTVKVQSAFISKFADIDFLKTIINISLYHSDFSIYNNSSTTSDIIKFIRKFLDDITKELNNPELQLSTSASSIKDIIKLINQILIIKDDISSRIITYDNVCQHFPNNIQITKILNSVINEQITEINDYRNKLDDVIQTIQIYNEFKEIKSSVFKLDGFLNVAQNSQENVYNLVSHFRDVILDSYNSLSSLKTISKNEQLSDYIVLSNEIKSNQLTERLVKFFTSGYTFLQSGYQLLDKCIGGIESSSVHIISGPSNHSKSIFMINMLRTIIENYEPNINGNDVAVFITLEDDIYKLMRRIFSIFGNYDSKIIRNLFIETSTIVKSQKYKDIVSSEKYKIIDNIISKIYNESIQNITANKNNNSDKIKIVLKHCSENTFSPEDVIKFIDTLHMNGYNVRLLMVDYLDVMIPSKALSHKADDYYAQGQIVHELRTISRNYKIPVITITQNTRSSEDLSQALNNTMLGDSIKKLRYTDYLYMIRQRKDLDLFGEVIKNDVNFITGEDDKSIFTNTNQEDFSYLIPVEIKITKAKEGEKDVKKFHLFNKRNLRIYDNMQQNVTDMKLLKTKSEVLQKEIDQMMLYSKIENDDFNFDQQLI